MFIEREILALIASALQLMMFQRKIQLIKSKILNGYISAGFARTANKTSLALFFTVYSALMAILFSFFLIYDTQQLMGGKKYSISPEEHIFAAIQVRSA